MKKHHSYLRDDKMCSHASKKQQAVVVERKTFQSRKLLKNGEISQLKTYIKTPPTTLNNLS